MYNNEVSGDDGMVVDNEGTIWIYLDHSESWGYISGSGAGFDGDTHAFLPQDYQPYVKLDREAQDFIQKALDHGLAL